jgi:hypothetical protein
MVYAGWLKDPTTMPPSVGNYLNYNHITPAYYPEILKADPFMANP